MAFAREVPPGHAALCGPRVAPLNLIPATPRLEWLALHHGPRCNYDSATDSNIPYTLGDMTLTTGTICEWKQIRSVVSLTFLFPEDNRFLWGGVVPRIVEEMRRFAWAVRQAYASRSDSWDKTLFEYIRSKESV